MKKRSFRTTKNNAGSRLHPARSVGLAEDLFKFRPMHSFNPMNPRNLLLFLGLLFLVAIPAHAQILATSYSVTGPATGVVSVVSANFTVTPNGYLVALDNLVVTPSDGGAGGTFTPTSLTFTPVGTAIPSPQTFTYTAASSGAKTLSFTHTYSGTPSISDPSSLTYTAGTNDVLTISSASIASDGRTLTINVGNIATPPLLPASGVAGFTVTEVDGTLGTWTQTVVAATAGTSNVTEVLPYQIFTGDTATVSYIPGTLTDSTGTPKTMAAQGPVTVTNNSSASPPNLAQIAAGNFATVPGLQAWYAPDGFYKDAGLTTPATANGDLVAGWKDKSGNGHTLVQATSGTRPLFETAGAGLGGVNAVSFTGSQHIDVTSQFGSTYNYSTSFYVVDKQTVNTSGFEWSANGNGLGFYQALATTPGNTLSPVPPSSGANNANSQSTIYSAGPAFPNGDIEQPFSEKALVYDGTTSLISSNFHPKTGTASAAISAAGTFTVGARSFGDFNFNGLTSQVLVCNQAHPPALRNAIEDGLIAQYAIPVLNEIMVEGDSISAGYLGTQPISIITTNLPATTYFNYNASVSGSTLSQILARDAVKIDPYFCVRRNRSVLLIMAGTNDLPEPGAVTATGTTLYNTLVNYCNLRRAVGWRVCVVTMLPRNSGDTNWEAARQQYNSLIRANWTDFADAIADWGNDNTMGQYTQNTNTTYYNGSGDFTHPTTAGDTIGAGYEQQAITGGTVYAQGISQPGICNVLYAGALTIGTVSSSSVGVVEAVATGQTGTVTYQLQRAPNILTDDTINNYNVPGAFANVSGVTATSPGTFTDMTASSATQYWYRIQTTDAGSGLVNYSNLLTATTAAGIIVRGVTGAYDRGRQTKRDRI